MGVVDAPDLSALGKVYAVFDFSIRNSKMAVDHSPLLELELGENSIDEYNKMVKAEAERLWLRAVILRTDGQ